VGELIGDVLDGLAGNPEDNSAVEAEVRAKVADLCARFPVYLDVV
jgi:glycine hydroxymethyltransferase